MNTLQDRVYATLTRGKDKNGYTRAEAIEMARDYLNRMDNTDFLMLISYEIADMLSDKEDRK